MPVQKILANEPCWMYFDIPRDRMLSVKNVTTFGLILLIKFDTAAASCFPMEKHLATAFVSFHS
jgi:hypothetical protein